MRIIFVDDSIAFDGYAPANVPLGGAEKALARLAAALATRGHAVEVYNRCEAVVNVQGATWLPLASDRPTIADVVIALRKPGLLDFVAQARRRVLWASGPTSELDTAEARSAIDLHKPSIIFFSQAQRNRWQNPKLHDTRVIAPGLSAEFATSFAMAPVEPFRALTLAHPLAGLDWLIKMWVAKIRPAVPGAELHVFSAVLDRAQIGETVAPAFKPVVDLIKVAREHGVSVRWPQSDTGMAEEYRAARVYLHPGYPDETIGLHLAECQAVGLPVVARATSPIAAERVSDGQSGTIARNNDAFSTAAISMLSDRIAFNLMSSNASSIRRGRTWPIVAEEWERMLE